MKKISIVTGASSGMGSEFVKELCIENTARTKKGFKFPKFRTDEIWAIARRADRLEELKSSFDMSVPGMPEIRTISLDLSGQKGALEFKNLLDAEKEKGEFEIQTLINNAGFGTYGEFANTDTVREMEMIDLDCTSLTGITGFALPYMNKGGRIIFTASLASFAPLGNFAVYGACKAYVLSLSLALAQELKHRGITVTALCPGSVSTEFANVASRGARKEVLHGLPADRTVRTCMKDARNGKKYSLWAFKWKFRKAAMKVLPASLIAWGTYKFNKRPSN